MASTSCYLTLEVFGLTDKLLPRQGFIWNVTNKDTTQEAAPVAAIAVTWQPFGAVAAGSSCCCCTRLRHTTMVYTQHREMLLCKGQSRACPWVAPQCRLFTLEPSLDTPLTTQAQTAQQQATNWHHSSSGQDRCSRRFQRATCRPNSIISVG